MKLLVDENVHADIVAWLRGAGHDVLYMAEAAPGAADEQVLARANRDDRVVCTDDKDFGELIFRQRLAAHGIILLRLTAPSIQDRIERLSAVWPEVEAAGPGRFVVVGEKKVRIRPLVMP